MKRSRDFSSSDSELDESTEIDKESADERGTLRTLSGSASPSAVSQLQARKRRRGIIEKRRRDRINHSLSELRRLVPSAFEKQGSAKLEKAEILQMTVDHLKMLHTVGGKGYLDAHALAMDYRGLGFRECLAETARYLSIMEGLDSADPLRVRLVSHLSSYASQREAHTGLGRVAWGSAFNTPSAHLQHRLLQQGAAPSHSANGSPSVENHAPSRLTCTARDEPGHGPLRVPPSGTIPPLLPVTVKLSPPILSSLSTSTFPFSFSSFPLISTEALSPSATSPTLGKPYRPWSMEIGAF